MTMSPSDDRIAYPKIVQYRTSDGEIHDLAPRDRSYTPVIHDLVKYEGLRGTGALYYGHLISMNIPELIDGRKAPGG